MAEVNITYETLFELLRREKTRESLQTLQQTFFEDVIKYLEEKKKFLEKQKNLQDLFADEERKKAIIQEENIRKIIKELYEKREKKIINMALDKSRTTASIIDTSVLLKEEKKIYDELLETMNKYRKEILIKILTGQKPTIEGTNNKTTEPQETTQNQDIKQEETEMPTNTEENPQIQTDNTKVKFIKTTQKFIGTDLKEYGPYNTGESAEIPKEIAEILIGNGTAEQVT